MTDSAIQKLNDKIVSVVEFPPSVATKRLGILKAWDCDFLNYLILGVLWLQQPAQRLVPLLLEQVAGKALHEMNIFSGWFVAQHCLGSVGNCHIRVKHLLPRLQQQVQFQEGECIVITCDPYILGSAFAHYQVEDLGKSVLFEGDWDIGAALALTKPSDCQRLLNRLPLNA
eukprot:gnl/TRDRNA2_/TRDRNA2_153402_c0_seq2.p1 gnl/TRDRNA2_/TRDRNA2_153402_c0~~gnl/TRDRNA2_/TRDRNA2_153402_c0_seq2.p1  ORF type:complete len:180 (+),score=23.21 gnl/TRDRNA2_/TRDRNA2_153402_c0_seq2:28-540(+)